MTPMTWVQQVVHVTLAHQTGDRVKCQLLELKEFINSSEEGQR